LKGQNECQKINVTLWHW